MYTRCPQNVDRLDGHCPVCHGDPDRCPTTARRVTDDPACVGQRIASSAGMRYSVEPDPRPRPEDTP